MMEAGCRNPDEWCGGVGFRLGSQLYVDCSEGRLPSDEAIDRLADHIKQRLAVVATPRAQKTRRKSRKSWSSP